MLLLNTTAQNVPLIETVVTSAMAVASLVQEEDQHSVRVKDQDWAAMQQQDEVLSVMIGLLEAGCLHSHQVARDTPHELSACCILREGCCTDTRTMIFCSWW